MILLTTTKPQQTLSEMYYDLTQAKNLLMQVTELPNHNRNFTPGEVGSIKQVIAGIERKRDAIVLLQGIV